MAKNFRRMFAMAMVLCMVLSALPMQALAAEGETFEQDGLTVTITPPRVPPATWLCPVPVNPPMQL